MNAEAVDGEVNLELLLIAFVLLGIAAWHILRWGEFWSGERKKTGAQFAILGWRWGRVGQSLYPIVGTSGIPISVALVSGFIEQQTTGGLQQVASVVSDTFGVSIFVAAAVLASIVLFNRPHFLIPPFARDFHGLFGDWVLSVFRRLTKRSASDTASDRADAAGQREISANRRRRRQRRNSDG